MSEIDWDRPAVRVADEGFMGRAIELARRGRGGAEPNPMVGCVLVVEPGGGPGGGPGGKSNGEVTGEIIGEGWHRQCGGPHAEVNAVGDARRRAADRVAGCTAYVTLEPCCHHGRTPPCTDLLIEAKIGRVVVGAVDPFEAVGGGGIARLRAAGIEVSVGCLADRCKDLIAPFAKRVRTGLPWVRAKWAMTMDGRIATASGSSRWVTGEAARADVHRVRAACDGILVGMGTIEADDPVLTARPTGAVMDLGELGEAPEANRTLHRMVICRRRVPSIDGRLMRSIDDAPVHLVVGQAVSDAMCRPLAAAGAVVHRSAGGDRSLAWFAVEVAGELSMSHLIVEGGSAILGAFFDDALVDQCDVYVGARVLGGAGALSPVGGVGAAMMGEASEFRLCDVEQLGGDVKLRYRRVGEGMGPGHGEKSAATR